MTEGQAFAATVGVSTADGTRPGCVYRVTSLALLAGGLAGTLDLIFAISAWSLQGVPAKIIPLSIASGILGKGAFAGGFGTVALGLALHYLIALSMAVTFMAAAAKVPTLTDRPIPTGAVYGAVLYIFMNFLVVPLSRAPIGRPPLAMALADLAAHMLLVGVPIALVAACRRSETNGGTGPMSAVGTGSGQKPN
jgi:hypothetical protein